MTTVDRAPTPEQARAELRTAVAVLTATRQVAAGTMTAEECGEAIAGMATELYGTDPYAVLTIVQPLGFLALGLARMVAYLADSTMDEVLAQLGADATRQS